jgi:lipid-A-disaccharide synthase-like uncharacterized protein
VSDIAAWWNQLTSIELTWVLIGLAGQSLFFMRFLLQWIATERARRSVVPEVFWYFSIGGGVIVLAYGIHRADPVIILGQCAGVTVYTRNLYFIWKEKLARKRTLKAQAADLDSDESLDVAEGRPGQP